MKKQKLLKGEPVTIKNLVIGQAYYFDMASDESGVYLGVDPNDNTTIMFAPIGKTTYGLLNGNVVFYNEEKEDFYFHLKAE